jgi:uncharacterized protein YuzE
MTDAFDQEYHQVLGNPVSYSNQIDENVIADYDAAGTVVGLEFLSPSAAKERDRFLALAQAKSLGPMKPGRPPEISGPTVVPHVLATPATLARS